MNMLEVDKIVLKYGVDSPAIIQGVSLTLHPSEFIAVVGPNGAGKSTLVKALTRVLAPAAGVVLLDGKDLYSATTARESARTIAAAPQSTTIAFDFTVREIVEMGRTPHRPVWGLAATGSGDADIVEDAMRQTGVLEFGGRIASTLSGGELQRVVLARALAQSPEILLLDEPTSSLDLHHQTHVLRLVRGLTRSRRMASLVVMHDLNLAAAYADRLVLVAGGAVVAAGTPADVLTEANLHAAYGARVWVRSHPITGMPYVLTLPESPLEGAETDIGGDRSVHVICGGGTGAGLMLRLRQLGFHATAGALNAGDTDQEAAEMLGVPYSREAPFTAFSESVVQDAARLASAADFVVITDVPFGKGNLANLQSAASACKMGKTVIGLDNPPIGDRDFAGGEAAAIWQSLIDGGMTIASDVDSLIDIVCNHAEPKAEPSN